MSMRTGWCCGCFWGFLLAEAAFAADAIDPRVQVEPGLRLELVASDPLIESPCALAFDERGNLYVAENRGYPTGPAEGEPPAGRIALLQDRNGDGVHETRTDFATGLSFPNGVLPWRGGLIVTCAPDVLFLKDTDGNGQADEHRVLLTGFSTKGSTQLRVSHPTLGIDGWVYLTSGLTGGQVTSPLRPEQPAITVGRTDLRFRPDTGELQACDGGAQFGLTFDDFGHRLICYNRVHVQHVVLASHWLRRNPHLPFSDTVENCPAEMAPEPLKGHGSSARVFPISQNVTTADSHAGTFTAACGVLVYRGTALPAAYRGGVFACDPTGNLVHFDRLEPHGATFRARGLLANREVLASRDDWFRPVYLANGPEGALYICDMYRKTIEHPDYLPAEIRKHTDFVSGKNKGHIYRLVATDADSMVLADRRSKRLADFSTEKLCQTLAADGWQRDTAQRLLIERNDPAAVPHLQKLLSAEPPASVHALYLLQILGKLDARLLAAALQHSSARVREVAVELASSQKELLAGTSTRLIELASDADARVRFDVALALGDVRDPGVLPALAEIGLQGATDRWTRAAVLSSLGGREVAFVDVLIARGREQTGSPELFYEFGRVLGASQPDDAWLALLRRTTLDWANAPADQQFPLLTGMADALRNRGRKGPHGPLFEALGTDAPPVVAEALRNVLSRAVLTAADRSQPLASRRWGAALAAHTDFALAGDRLLGLIDPQEPEVLQTTAIRGLVGMPDDSVVKALLSADRFPRYAPRVREEVLASLASATQKLPALLDALESGLIAPADLDASLRRQLNENRDEAIRTRAAKLFGAAVSADRVAVYENHKEVLQLAAHPENGRQLFKKHCAQCHRLDRDGVPVGPDLFGIRNQPKEAILLHILIPEREITTGFNAYTVVTRDGRTLSGLIASETPTSITLRQAQGKEDVLLRDDIEELVASKTSLMPQGLEKTINHQEFADLLAYLKGEQTE